MAAPTRNKTEPYSVVSNGDFGGVTQPIVASTSPWFRFVQPFAAQLSYIYSQPAERPMLGMRIERYFKILNTTTLAVTSCLGRGLFVATSLLKTEKISINFAENEEIISCIQYLYNSVTLGNGDSVNNKVKLCRKLFAEIVLGIKHLEDCPIEGALVDLSKLEDYLKARFANGSELVFIGIQWKKENSHHGLFCVSGAYGHYLIDVNLPIIKFDTREDLCHWGPKIYRTIISGSSEISSEILQRNKLPTNSFNRQGSVFRCYTFQNVSDRVIPTNAGQVIADYSKVIWSLPYESSPTRTAMQLWKVQIQVFIYLLKNIDDHPQYHFPPFRLSPLTAKGVKERMIVSLTNPPFSLKGSENLNLLESTANKIYALSDACTQIDFIRAVLTLVHSNFGTLKTTAESGEQVAQFRFADAAAAVMNPIGVKEPT